MARVVPKIMSFVIVGLTMASMAPLPLANECPASQWRIGDRWQLRISKAYRRFIDDGLGIYTDKDEIVDWTRYSMDVEVKRREVLGDVECWVLAFTAGEGVGGRITGSQYLLWVSGEDCVAKKAKHDFLGAQVTQFGTIVTTGSAWFPLDFVSWEVSDDSSGVCKGDKKKEKSPSRKATINKRPLDNGMVHLTLKIEDKEDRELYRLEEVWEEGASWWKTYARYVKGNLDIKAELVSPGETVDQQPDPEEQ